MQMYFLYDKPLKINYIAIFVLLQKLHKSNLTNNNNLNITYYINIFIDYNKYV